MTVALASVLSSIPSLLRSELLSEFDKIVRNYREGRWEPAELNGGKFCEVVFAIVDGFVRKSYPDKVAKPHNFLDSCRKLEQSSKSAAPHSFRILIPRLLPGLYDIRSNRGVAHVGGDVDPNRMDAAIVVSMARWILAELIRVFHGVSIDEAQGVVDGLVDRMVPVIWELPDGRVRVLKASLSMRERMLVVLYRYYPDPLSERFLVDSVEHSNASIFRRDILRKAHKEALVHYDENDRVVYLSQLGIREVEENVGLEL